MRRHGSWIGAGLLACGLGSMPAGTARAQTAPSAAEAAAYTGLHAAAQRGNAAQLQTLAAAGADLDARDGNGRTPLHVATFARQREAIRALAKLGASWSYWTPTVTTP